MLMYAYAIRDIKAEDFAAPMFFNHPGIAARSFGDAVRAPDSALNSHPEDFQLFELGTYDTSTAGFKSYSQPRHVADATSYVSQTPPHLIANNG